jgi:hypothetical protein
MFTEPLFYALLAAELAVLGILNFGAGMFVYLLSWPLSLILLVAAVVGTAVSLIAGAGGPPSWALAALAGSVVAFVSAFFANL